MNEQHFNLVDEAWVSVLRTDGTPAEVSLRTVFHEAENIRTLTGELSTQSFAILRLLLAVLHRSVEGPEDLDHWEEIRSDWPATLRLVDEYLNDFHDRFWLQDPNAPFFQVPDLHTAKNEVFELTRIIADGPGAGAFITTRLGRGQTELSWAEAARWLVHVHAYDLAGIHTGAVGDARVKGGKGYGIGTGWAGQIGGVYAVGGTLRDTLLLNLVVPESARLQDDPDIDDEPVWEREPLTTGPEGWPEGRTDLPYRQPTGPVDLYTWPSRRIRLFGDREKVTGVINAQGDRATPQNRQQFEPMTVWRYSEPQTKKFGRDTYMPRTHDPERAFWRGLSALLPTTARASSGHGPARFLEPGLSSWFALLQHRRKLIGGFVRLHAIGVEYGSNEAVYAEIVDDSLTLPETLFAPEAAELAYTATEAVAAAETAVGALTEFAANIVRAAGGSEGVSGARSRLSGLAYAELDTEFRGWVRTLTEEAVAGERRDAWQRTVRFIIGRLAEDVLRDAGPAALIGRRSNGHHLDAGKAEAWFSSKLRKALPHAFGPQHEVPSIRPDQEVA